MHLEKFYFINIFNLYKSMFKLKINSHVHILDFSSIFFKRPDCFDNFTFSFLLMFQTYVVSCSCIAYIKFFKKIKVIYNHIGRDRSYNCVSYASMGVDFSCFISIAFKNWSWFPANIIKQALEIISLILISKIRH